jgi:hypothetical protein
MKADKLINAGRGVGRRIRIHRAKRYVGQSYRSLLAPIERAGEPVIVVGMHRSGTSLLSRVLSALDVDMGSDVSPVNHESRAFVARNEMLLAVAGASWDRPAPFVEALRDPRWRDAFGHLAGATLDAPIGWCLTSVRRSDTAAGWGWKDPRSSITWPIWLALHPNARFVRIERFRDDAVASLVARSRRLLGVSTQLSIRTVDPAGAGDLYDEYAQALLGLDAVVERDRLLDISYDELVVDPVRVVSTVATWIGADSALVDDAARLVRRRS